MHRRQWTSKVAMASDPDIPLTLQVWTAVHYEHLDARECSLRYGIPKPRVLALLADYRPIAEAAEFAMMSKSKGIPDPEQPAKLARQRIAGARRRAAAKQKEHDHDAG
jgi:hypothetical protein